MLTNLRTSNSKINAKMALEITMNSRFYNDSELTKVTIMIDQTYPQ